MNATILRKGGEFKQGANAYEVYVAMYSNRGVEVRVVMEKSQSAGLRIRALEKRRHKRKA